jgi:hypothetical protein
MTRHHTVFARRDRLREVLLYATAVVYFFYALGIISWWGFCF